MNDRSTHHHRRPSTELEFVLPTHEEMLARMAYARQLQAEAVAATLRAAGGDLRRLVGSAGRAIARRRREAATRAMLAACSDRTLADIGIAREHISLVAKGLDPNAVDPASLTWRGRGAALLARLEAVRARLREQRRIRRELMGYSDHELNDLGLAPRDIPLIARTA